jgi:Rrf2 family nitric oxide-sensitive transcriptional repressor
MRLTKSSDYALRLMMLLARSAEMLSIEEAADRLRLPKSQLMKIAADLAETRLIVTQRGRGGGISLGRAADKVSVGEIVRTMERDFAVVDCLREGPCDCVFLPRCKLTRVMTDAADIFLSYLDRFTLSEVATAARLPSW